MVFEVRDLWPDCDFDRCLERTLCYARGASSGALLPIRTPPPLSPIAGGEELCEPAPGKSGDGSECADLELFHATPRRGARFAGGSESTTVEFWSVIGVRWVEFNGVSILGASGRSFEDVRASCPDGRRMGRSANSWLLWHVPRCSGPKFPDAVENPKQKFPRCFQP